MSDRAAAYIVYDGATPVLFIVAQSPGHAAKLVMDNLADVPAARIEPALTAPLADLQRLVAILQGQFVITQLAMMREMSGPIQLLPGPGRMA